MTNASDDDATKRPILTVEQIRELLAEGLKAREELHKRFEKMRQIRCTCHKNMCDLHDKAK